MITKSQNEITKKWKANWSEPLVSIRCTVFNHESYLEDCLDGFLLQETNFPFEVFVHDDASTDNSVAIIKKYEEKFPNIIKPLYEKENQWSKDGDSFMNATWDFARLRGKYVALCEGDDYWIDPLKLQKQIDVLESDPSITLVHTGFYNVDSQGQTFFRKKYEQYQKISRKETGLTQLLNWNYILTVSVVMRKDVISSTLYKGSPFFYDYTYFLGAAFLGKIKYIPDRTCAYRKNPNGITQHNLVGISKELYCIFKYFANHYLSLYIKEHKIDHPILSMFFILKNVIMFKDISFFLKIVFNNPIRLMIVPFSFAYAVLISLSIRFHISE